MGKRKHVEVDRFCKGIPQKAWWVLPRRPEKSGSSVSRPKGEESRAKKKTSPAESAKGAGLERIVPQPMSEGKRQPVLKKHKKAAIVTAAAIQPADTLTKRAARVAGELEDEYRPIETSDPDKDHSKRFGEEIARHLSGKGLRFDHMEVGNHVIRALRGGGVHMRDLLATYVHGKVPAKWKRFQHPPVTKHHSRTPARVGGSLGIRHFEDGAPVSNSHVWPSHIKIL